MHFHALLHLVLDNTTLQIGHTSQIEASSYYTAIGMACLFAFLFLLAVIIATLLGVSIIIIRKKLKSANTTADQEPILQQGKLLTENNIQREMLLIVGLIVFIYRLYQYIECVYTDCLQ